MRNGTALVVVLSAALSACTYQVTSAPIPELPASTTRLPVGVDPSVQPAGGDAVAEAVLQTSTGTIARLTNQPLVLTATVKPQPREENSVFLGVFSLFLPPLAFVSENFTDTFVGSYAVSDRSNRLVYQNSVTVPVAGSMAGWYVARINARQDLFEEAAKYAARSMAKTIVEDLLKRRAELSAGAAPPPPVEAAAPAGGSGSSGAGAPAGAKPWWQQ